MSKHIVVLAPIRLAPGKTEADLLAASRRFEEEFVSKQPGVLQRELVRKADDDYIDIVRFRSEDDMRDVMEKEQQSVAFRDYLSVMNMEGQADAQPNVCRSIALYS